MQAASELATRATAKAVTKDVVKDVLYLNGCIPCKRAKAVPFQTQPM